MTETKVYFHELEMPADFFMVVRARAEQDKTTDEAALVKLAIEGADCRRRHKE